MIISAVLQVTILQDSHINHALAGEQAMGILMTEMTQMIVMLLMITLHMANTAFLTMEAVVAIEDQVAMGEIAVMAVKMTRHLSGAVIEPLLFM